MSYIAHRHREALNELTVWLTREHPEARIAPSTLLKEHGLEGYTAWMIPLGNGVELIAGVDAVFPYSDPKTAFRGSAEQIHDPHVERNQRLCTFGPDAALDSRNAVGVFSEYIEASRRLLASNAAGENREDYFTDFQAYWARASVPRLIIIGDLQLQLPSRIIATWQSGGSVYAGETTEKLRSWVQNRFGIEAGKHIRIGALIYVDPLPEPGEYPTTPIELRRIVARTSADGIGIFDETIASSDARRAVIIMGKATDMRVAAGGLIIESRGSNNPHARSPGRGFRPGKIPADVLARSSSLIRVGYGDASEGLTRLPKRNTASVREKRVHVIGCGSLGAGVARLLAQSAVGHLTMVDPDLMGWANIYRHELGALEVGETKAEAMALHLRKRLPSIKTSVGLARNWMRMSDNRMEELKASDLIISLTGSWNAEAALSDFHRSERMSMPLLFGWLERGAAAAHALAVGPRNQCFRCGFDHLGNALLPATEWLEPEENEQCAGATSTYGSIDLGFAQSLIAGLAIDLLLDHSTAPAHRVWLGRGDQLQRAGGFWSEKWIKAVGHPGRGGNMIGAPWPVREGCECQS